MTDISPFLLMKIKCTFREHWFYAQMIKEFRFNFEDLQVQAEDLHELLGFDSNTIPAPFPEYINMALKRAGELCQIKGGYKIFDPIRISQSEQKLHIDSTIFNPAKIVCTQLKEASAGAIFLCTAGESISLLSKQLLAGEDPMLGYVFDVLGSITVEKATDKIQLHLNEEVKNNGLNISDRYSPGYCEWSVNEQKKLFALLPDNFCGITLSESSLMHPIKSVSGIIGIGKKLKQKGYQCQWCSDPNCIYGKIRRKK